MSFCSFIMFLLIKKANLSQYVVNALYIWNSEDGCDKLISSVKVKNAWTLLPHSSPAIMTLCLCKRRFLVIEHETVES